jgi:hypothetical protein
MNFGQNIQGCCEHNPGGRTFVRPLAATKIECGVPSVRLPVFHRFLLGRLCAHIHVPKALILRPKPEYG